jgi:uncharacterized protein (TIGR00297 family)
LILAALAVLGRALTPGAGMIAAGFGVVIVVLAGFPFLALLALFVFISASATRFRFEEKRRRHVQEGNAGERGVSNVVAHILIPTGLAILGATSVISLPTLAVLFASAMAFGASDTFASEFGVLNGRAVSIVSFRPVTPGTNGGVSGIGEAFGAAGSAATAVIGLLLLGLFASPVGSITTFLIAVTVAGFIGCQVDSVVGELFENRGLLSKGGTNFLGMLAAVGVALAVVHLVGGVG